MDYREEGTVFSCGDSRMLGITAIPAEPASIAVLFLVGGPQYRAGSHRQFTLLARNFAARGFASLRFDYPGMGDSYGQSVAFSTCDAEVEAAVEHLHASVPSAKHVVLWGLCDAASTAMMFAHRLPTVRGGIFVNPWVHGGEYSPGFRLSHYYGPLLSDRQRWKRLLSGNVDIKPAIADTVKALSALLSFKRKNAPESSHVDFVDGMLRGCEAFKYEMLFMLSEKDLTAKEFMELSQQNKRWCEILKRNTTQTHKIAGADHTFSRSQWREEVASVALGWLQRLSGQ
ncbi:MAG: hydrolase 1, exosortase A system-associated [Halioglobus sp.]